MDSISGTVAVLEVEKLRAEIKRLHLAIGWMDAMVTGARCSQCDGSGWDDKAGPRDDELLDRVVLSAITIDELRTENERLRSEIEIWKSLVQDCERRLKR